MEFDFIQEEMKPFLFTDLVIIRACTKECHSKTPSFIYHQIRSQHQQYD